VHGRQRLLAIVVSAVLVATGGLSVAGPASADDPTYYISQIDINLGFSPQATPFGDLGGTTTVNWYLCDTRTSFVSTRADSSAAWPPAADSAVTAELSNNGCELVPVVAGQYQLSWEYVYEDGGLFKTPIKPYLAVTDILDDTAAYPEPVLAVSQGAVLRTLDSLPTLSKSGTTWTATDGVWGGGLGAPDANHDTVDGAYLVCDSPFGPAGASNFDESLFSPGNVLFECAPLFSSVFYVDEVSGWTGVPVTDLILSESATVYRDLPTGGPDDTPVPYDLTGKNLVRAVSGYPFFAWSCSQPSCPTQSAEVTVTPSPASPSITYGASTPTLTPSYSGYSGSDTAATAPTCKVYVKDSSTEVTASPIPVGTYDTQCSGGDAGTNYQFSFSKGSLTVNKLTPTVTYTGGTSVIRGDNLTLSSTISSGSCTGAITYKLSKNPLTGVVGDYPLGSSPVSTTDWLPGTYTVTATYPGDANCSTASKTASLVIASQEVEGSGTYTSPQGLATFDFEIEDPREHGGNPGPSKITWTVAGKWKFTGLLSMNWRRTGDSGTTTGTGTVYKWLKVGSTYKWVSQGSNVATTIKFTQTTRKVGSVPANPGSFAIGFTGAGFPSLPANTAPLTKGSIKYEMESGFSVPN